MKSVFASRPDRAVRGALGAIDALFAKRASGTANEDNAERARGFYESSFDLRTGLEVSEAPLAELPAEFQRQFSGAGRAR